MRTPSGLNLLRTALMLQWRVRAVGRAGGGADGEITLNVPKGIEKGKKLRMCWQLQTHHLKIVMLLLPQIPYFLNSCQNLKRESQKEEDLGRTDGPFP